MSGAFLNLDLLTKHFLTRFWNKMNLKNRVYLSAVKIWNILIKTFKRFSIKLHCNKVFDKEACSNSKFTNTNIEFSACTTACVVYKPVFRQKSDIWMYVITAWLAEGCALVLRYSFEPSQNGLCFFIGYAEGNEEQSFQVMGCSSVSAIEYLLALNAFVPWNALVTKM